MSRVKLDSDWLDEAAQEDLRSMLEEWRSRKEVTTPFTAPRPVFKGKRRNSGIHCNEEILSRALKKAKDERAVTGGSLSLVVERLLWVWIGSPKEVLEPMPGQDGTSHER